MNRTLGCLVAIALASPVGAALSQTSMSGAALDGSWTAKYLEDGRWPREARLELKGASGQYQFYLVIVNRPLDSCDRATAPVNVEQTADEVVVIAKYSQVVSFCPDRTLKLKKTSDRTLEGAFGDGTPVSVTKN